MATYIVATRRDYRGKTETAKDALSRLPGVRIKAATDPNLVIIEIQPERAELVRRELGASYRVEAEILHETM